MIGIAPTASCGSYTRSKKSGRPLGTRDRASQRILRKKEDHEAAEAAVWDMADGHDNCGLYWNDKGAAQKALVIARRAVAEFNGAILARVGKDGPSQRVEAPEGLDAMTTDVEAAPSLPKEWRGLLRGTRWECFHCGKLARRTRRTPNTYPTGWMIMVQDRQKPDVVCSKSCARAASERIYITAWLASLPDKREP